MVVTVMTVANGAGRVTGAAGSSSPGGSSLLVGTLGMAVTATGGLGESLAVDVTVVGLAATVPAPGVSDPDPETTGTDTTGWGAADPSTSDSVAVARTSVIDGSPVCSESTAAASMAATEAALSSAELASSVSRSAAADCVELVPCESSEPGSLRDSIVIVGFRTASVTEVVLRSTESRRLTESGEALAAGFSALESRVGDEREVESLVPVSAAATAQPALPIRSAVERTMAPVEERTPCIVGPSLRGGLNLC